MNSESHRRGAGRPASRGGTGPWPLKIVLLSFGVSCGALLGLSGCAAPDIPQHDTSAEETARTSFWQPYLLLIQATPYPRLYVEVDAVEGMAPEDDNLSRLRTFLAAYCQKPAGIDVVRDSLISRDQARGIPRETLARKYMAGPRNKAGAPPAAYMYVLFYDSALVGEIGVHTAPTPARKADASSRSMPAKPYASLLPYPAAIYIDPNILGSKRPDKVSLVSGTFLQHEAGHLLGIGRNPMHAVGGHCLDTSCLMYRQYDLGDLLLQEFAADIPGEVPRIHFCAKCEADVQAYLAQPSPTNLHFVGPVLVRSEEGYHVLTLPDRIELIVGEFDERDAWKFLRTVQSEALKPRSANSGRITALVKPEARQNRPRLSETLKRARQDSYDAVREVAKKLW